MDKSFNLFQGDCLEVLKEFEDNTMDSIVCDPPYGLSFMGKQWDYDVPSQEIWEQCLRVLKPGGHLLAFAGSRTYHRMAVRIEDAGFEIRDQIMWIYGSGFPKSHNIGKGVDKIQGNEREVVGPGNSGRDMTGGSYGNQSDKQPMTFDITKGNPPWEGWGTALKPAHEPIVMARKPFKGSVVENVLEWGTGGINIDGCRIPSAESDKYDIRTYDTYHKTFSSYAESNEEQTFSVNEKNELGRFPANIIFDEEAGKMLDEQSGTRKGFSGGGGPTRFGGATGGEKLETYNYHKDTGGASRFFYCPKASKKDRNEGLKHLPISRPDERTETGMGSFKDKGIQPQQNIHPTVKPTDLMLYLIRLVTPKSGITLDPFMGSGSTGKAALRGGFKFVGIECEAEYLEIAKARIEHELGKAKQTTIFE